jgi:hypothetical protein
MNSLDVLRKERDELAGRVKALDSAIAALRGGKAGGGSYKRSKATRAKLSAALKASWAKKKNRVK